MSWMEERNRIFSSIKTKLSGQYEQEDINGNICFKNKNGMYFRLFEFPGENALCIEYAENKKDAASNMFEDGDRYYIDELNEYQMYEAMIKEIEE